MEENEEFDSDFNKENIPISGDFWNYMESYWHNNREFPESTEDHLKRKADLIGGKVPSSQLPSYVDDVVEFEFFENLPNPGEKGKIYVIINNNSQYRWSGSEYIQLNSDEHFMTVNTNQGISGIKNFFTGGGNYAPFNNTLQIYADDGSLPSMTYSKGGSHVGQIMFDTNGFHFKNGDNNNHYNVKSKGFIKDGSDDDYLLTGGGGHLNKYSKEDAWFHSSRNFINGTLIETDIDYSGDYGHQFLLELKGNMYFNSLPLEAKIQGYIYNGTIIAQSGYSTLDYWNLITALNFNGKLCFWFSRMSYWQGFDVKVTAGYGGLDQGKNRVTSVSDNPDPGGTKRVEIYLNKLLTKEELVSKNIFQPSGNYTTIDTEQTISASKEYYSSMPFKFKRTDAKSWVFHKPANNNLIFAPSSSNNAEDWNWSNQIVFNDNGTVSANGFIKNGSSNDYLLLGDGSHKAISDFVKSSQLGNYLNKSGDAMTGNLTVPNLILSSNTLASNTLNGSQVLATIGDTMYFGNTQGLDYLNFQSTYGLTHYQNGVVGTIWTAHNFNPHNYIPTSHHVYSITSDDIKNWENFVGYWDNRSIKPNHISPEKLQIGFTSLNNDTSYPYADYLHFGGYADLSGGMQNLIMFGKNSFGIRQYLGDYQSATTYKDYVDYWHTNNLPQSHVDYLAYLTSNGAATISWSNQNYLNSNPLNTLGNNHDANNLNKSGFYSIGYETKNTGDYTSSKDGIRALLHLETENLYSASQLQTERYNGNILSRTKTDGLWSSWVRHWGNNDFTQNNIDDWNYLVNNAATQSWIHSQNYITPDFVEEKLNELSGEITNPDSPFSIRNKFTIIIITEDYHDEPLYLDGELIPESYLSIINLSKRIIDLNRFEPTIDRISELETTEYYINQEQRLIKKGSYRNAQILT